MGSPTNRFKEIWHAKIPLKIKIFMRQAIHGKLPSADQNFVNVMVLGLNFVPYVLLEKRPITFSLSPGQYPL